MADDSEAEDFYPPALHPWFGKRRTDSAEKYFDWAGKTNRKLFNMNHLSIFTFHLSRSYGIPSWKTLLAFRQKR